MNVRDEIMRRVDALPPDAQRELLTQLEGKEETAIRGNTLADFLPFIGSLDEQSAREMMEAIEAECENIDPDEDIVFGETQVPARYKRRYRHAQR